MTGRTRKAVSRAPQGAAPHPPFKPGHSAGGGRCWADLLLGASASSFKSGHAAGGGRGWAVLLLDASASSFKSGHAAGGGRCWAVLFLDASASSFKSGHSAGGGRHHHPPPDFAWGGRAGRAPPTRAQPLACSAPGAWPCNFPYDPGSNGRPSFQRPSAGQLGEAENKKNVFLAIFTNVISKKLFFVFTRAVSHRYPLEIP